MQATTKPTYQEEWIKILAKGMITIPKTWRDELGLKEGEVIKAKKMTGKIIIEQKEKNAPYRIYSQEELERFLKDDKLPKKLTDKAAKYGKKIR